MTAHLGVSLNWDCLTSLSSRQHVQLAWRSGLPTEPYLSSDLHGYYFFERVRMQPPFRKRGIKRPWADRAASSYSTRKRARRSLCSTTMVLAIGSLSKQESLRRLPFIPDPTSVTTSEIDMPCALAQSVKRSI